MADPNQTDSTPPTHRPRSAPVSLDELFDANKAQFDQLFARQSRAAESLRGNGGHVEPVAEPFSPAGPSKTDAGDGANTAAEQRLEARPSPQGNGEHTHGVSTSGDLTQSATSPARASTRDTPLDTITLDLIENALRNARHEMDAVLFRSAMSPVIREQHDEFPMITDP
ncbi:MAG: hydantoinase B/oxoprolinase family protein, partial [Gammaproteobacteria bacterium]